ncbi:MAG TPA: glycosyltransferase family 2 protein [Xanthobacteraceae bacterium]|nr:glycosyltransferase family 2 protein [Xanthobacteraceae bacterium]
MTITRDNIWVVIPAFNEGQVIADVVAGVVREGYRVVLVDDGSADATGDFAAAAGADVVRHPINLGQGAGLQTGIAYALARGADAIVTFDADGQHRASEIALLIETLARENADFVLGSRFKGAAVNLPPRRRLLLKAATLFTRVTTGLDVSDAHNGFRALSRRGAQAITLRQNRMAHASEILHEIARSGLRYVEAPVTIEYSAYSLAKGQKISDSIVIMVDLFARRLHR